MERLTYDFAVGENHCWQVHGADNLMCEEVCSQYSEKGCKECPIGKAIDRLAHYEDLGMTPEEIQQTLENFSAFLCEVTGTRMSKTNYTKEAMIKAVHDYFDRLCDECYARKEYARYKDLEEQGRLAELPVGVGQIVWFTVYGNTPTATVVHKASYVLQSDGIYAYYETEDSCGNTDYFHGEAIGKTVFRSRPEAEAALAASGKEG